MDNEFLVFFKSTWYKLSWVALFWVWVGFYLTSYLNLNEKWFGLPVIMTVILFAYTSLVLAYKSLPPSNPED